DLPLLSQFWTASRLNVSSNIRRVLTVSVFMGWLVHCSPNSPSVNSKQPQMGVSRTRTGMRTRRIHFSLCSMCSLWLNKFRDSQHHLRLVGHARGRFTRRFE